MTARLTALSLVACGTCAGPSTGADVRAVYELEVASAAERWTAWLDRETAAAERLPPPERAPAVARLAALNAEWDGLEATFTAAGAEYAGRALACAAALTEAKRQTVAAQDAALAFLVAQGVP